MPRRFDEPDAPRLLSFGGGPHYCLGAALARTTLEESVRGVAELAPTLAADPESIEWSQVLGRSPARLPVTISASVDQTRKVPPSPSCAAGSDDRV